MKRILATSLLCLLSSFAFAQSSQPDNQESASTNGLPINLQADHGEFDANNNTATYTGNVVVTQGDMILKGDKMVITLLKGEVNKIENWGNLAYFHYVPQNDPPVDGKGQYMIYQVPKDTIDIDGKAWIKREDNETNANHITYHISEEKVEGKGVRMTLIPKSEDNE